MPKPVIEALGIIKTSCALINIKKGMDPTIGNAIVEAAKEVISPREKIYRMI